MKKLCTCIVLAAMFFVSCNSKVPTKTATDSTANYIEKNRQTALKVENLLIQKNLDGMMAACAANFIDYGNGEEKPMNNLDTIKAGIKSYLDSFPDLKGEDLTAFAHGDSVIVLGTWSATFKRDFMGMKATQKSYKYPDADVFTFDKYGKIASHRSLQSSISFFSQLGIAAEPKK